MFLNRKNTLQKGVDLVPDGGFKLFKDGFAARKSGARELLTGIRSPAASDVVDVDVVTKQVVSANGPVNPSAVAKAAFPGLKIRKTEVAPPTEAPTPLESPASAQTREESQEGSPATPPEPSAQPSVVASPPPCDAPTAEPVKPAGSIFKKSLGPKPSKPAAPQLEKKARSMPVTTLWVAGAALGALAAAGMSMQSFQTYQRLQASSQAFVSAQAAIQSLAEQTKKRVMTGSASLLAEQATDPRRVAQRAQLFWVPGSTVSVHADKDGEQYVVRLPLTPATPAVVPAGQPLAKADATPATLLTEEQAIAALVHPVVADCTDSPTTKTESNDAYQLKITCKNSAGVQPGSSPR